MIAEARAALDALRAPLAAGLEVDNTPSAFLSSIFLVRCARNLAAVLVLCETGWAPEAQTLLRAMVEDMVTLSYISTDPDPLALKWLRFENRRLPDAEQLLAVFAGREMPERTEQPKYERWTRLGFSDMAKRAEKVVPGILEYLRYVYPILSDRAHGNTSASSMYMRVHPNGTVEPLYLPSGNQVAITLCNAVTAVYTTSERVRTLGVTIDIRPIELAEKRIYDACGLPLEIPDDPGD